MCARMMEASRVSMPEIESAAQTGKGTHTHDAIVEISTQIYRHQFVCFLINFVIFPPQNAVCLQSSLYQFVLQS
jgi:hypothetical protein